MTKTKSENQLDGLRTGRIVDYVCDTGRGTFEHYAAIVASVLNPETGAVNLCVFTPWCDVQPRKNVAFDSTASKPDTWHWLERA